MYKIYFSMLKSTICWRPASVESTPNLLTVCGVLNFKIMLSVIIWLVGKNNFRVFLHVVMRNSIIPFARNKLSHIFFNSSQFGTRPATSWYKHTGSLTSFSSKDGWSFLLWSGTGQLSHNAKKLESNIVWQK